MKPLSCASQFILWQQKAVKSNFQEKEQSHKCSTLEFARLFAAAAATVLYIKNLTSGELKARSSLHFCFDPKNFFKFESIAMHDII